ncbi:MAG: hypothetical protein CMQ54_00185 [Gammaproteobacteria bacterium]|nr:hypothetical protein [Gammaproteobacteria bacterium]|tara:strand:- start:3597 stop:4190 length:594 start_codon:yes stop_codon:yes gene_type:complete
MTNKLSKPIIHACVLAAGQSSRFGKTKLTQIFRGLPMVQHALLAAQGACKNRVSLIVGHNADAVIEASGGLADSLILNSNFKNGLGSSIATAVNSTQQIADAVLIILGDQPLVSSQQLKMLIKTWSGSSNEIIASSYSGTEGPPILFPKDSYPSLINLKGELGAKKVMNNIQFSVKKIQLPSAGFDIDTQEDFNNLN